MDAIPEAGSLVELHSLSRADLNGARGFCGAWDAAKERFSVELLQGGSSMAVRPINLRCPPPAEPENREQAVQLTTRAATLLSDARDGALVAVRPGATTHKEAASMLLQAEELLKQAEQADAACSFLLLNWIDLAMMRGNRQATVVYARRAVANRSEDSTEQVKAHMALAAGLAYTGDRAGEEKQLRIVLRSEPEHLQARLSLGMCLKGDDAIPELMMALQLPSSGAFSAEQAAVTRREAAHQLKVIYIRRVIKHQDCCENDGMLNMIGKVLELHERFPAEAADTNHIYVGRSVTEMETVHAANFHTYRAIAHLRLGQIAEAEEAATLAVQLTKDFPPAQGSVLRPFALCTLGNVKERQADEQGGDRALYAEAKELYLAAHHAGSDDPTTDECFKRVQAKTSPDLVFTLNAARIGLDMCLSGAAKALRPFRFEELPPR